ncbi:MAG: T9SS type A sorting domain-containing protein, partial [Aureispira sp.]|nr:T9SS type A sorting domain-containing protein [Aureispira sp.]
IDDYFTIIKNIPLTSVNSIPTDDRPTLEVHPNPSSDIINITTKATLKFVQIFDNKGTEIKFINGHPKTVNVEGLPNGLYIVAGTTADGQHLFQKLVVGE